MTDRTKFLTASFILFLIIITLFYSSLHFGFVGLDDTDLVVRNPDLKVIALDRLWVLVSKSYITLNVPLTMLSYWVDYQIWRLTPFGFHFTNVVLHFLNTLLVLWFLKLFHKNWSIAFATALFFAIHPVQIESVVWIAERKNLLSTFFFFWALITYWNAVKGESPPKKQNKFLIFSLIFYAAGVWSKPSVVIFLPIIFSVNFFLLNRSFEFKKRWWFYGLTILMAVLSTIITIFGTAVDVEKYKFHGGSYGINLLIMIPVFWRYVGLLLFPYKQNILYSSLKFNSFFNSQVLGSAMGLIFFALAFFVLYKKGRKAICFWLSWFVISLLPVSNLLAPLPSIMNDRYLYIPIIGFFTAFFLILSQISDDLLFSRATKVSRAVTSVVIFLLAFPFLILSIQRLPNWKDSTSLWTSAVERATRMDPRIFYFSGVNQIDSGHYEQAIELLKKSLQLDTTTDARLALGTAYVAAEKYDLAEIYLKKVIEIDPKRAGAYDQLGAVYRKIHKFKEAENMFKKALLLQSRNAVIYNNYALLKMDLGRTEEARQNWERALELDPDCHFALSNLSWFYFARHEYEPAARYLVRYLRLNPHDIRMLMVAQSIQRELEKGKS